MTPAELSRTVLRAVRRAVDEDVLRAQVPERAVVERPRPGGRGDYATNVALKLAGPAGLPAREVAEILRGLLVTDASIAGIEVTGPGFLNFTLAHDVHTSVVRTILTRGRAYGHGAVLAGEVVRVGPGLRDDAVARLLHAMGASVARSVSVIRSASVARDASATGARTGTGTETEMEDAESDGSAAPVARLGRDAAAWSLIWPTAVPAPEDLLVQRETNPLFRVRYAHARTRALTRNATALGFRAGQTGGEAGRGGDAAETAETESGAALLRALADYPAALEAAARHRAPDRLARHLDRVAEAFFRFHDTHSVLPRGDEKPSVAHRSRLALAEATGTVLAGGLSLLGISAPEHL
ncbi:ArgS-related anticodon-binding protein NrtL [Streptomyces altiplanensis]